MEADIGHIVISLAGRDKGRLFYVLKTEENFVYLVDGSLRRIETAKKKKRKHIRVVSDFETRVCLKIRSGDKISNSEIRKALSGFVKPQPEDDAVSSTGR